MEAQRQQDDYPEEIDEQLSSFGSSVSSVKTMLEKLMSIPRNEQPQKVEGSFFFNNKQKRILLGFIVLPLFTAEPFGSSQVGSDVCLHAQFLILE